MHWGHGMSCHSCPLRPKSRGTLTLASRDAREAPRIDPGYLSDADDLETMVRGFKLVRRIFAQPAFAPFGGADLSRELYFGDGAHRRRDPGRDPGASRHDLSPGRHLPHGIGRPRRGRYTVAGARYRWAACRRRVRDADAGFGQHQCTGGDDRRACRGPDPSRDRRDPAQRAGFVGTFCATTRLQLWSRHVSRRLSAARLARGYEHMTRAVRRGQGCASTMAGPAESH